MVQNRNLDALINKIAYEIVEKINKDKNKDKKYIREIDKSLGVLANDGVYAYYVYVKARGVDDVFLEKKKIKEIATYCGIPISDGNLETFFNNLSGNLQNLFFFREILEKILIYARYHAKALGD